MDDRTKANSSVRSRDTSPTGTLVLTRRDIRELMTPLDYVEAVRAGFMASATGKASAPPPMHIARPGGGFHAKGAAMQSRGSFVAVKLNGNFPTNPSRGLPTIQGAVLLCDGENGRLLAILDSIEVTLKRTAAATALAAQFLTPREASVITICGCGEQGREHLRFLASHFSLEIAHAWDSDPEAARRFARDMARELDIAVRITLDLAEATTASDIVITTTTARAPFLYVGDVQPGTFIGAVGADNPDKSEITPQLLASSKLVVDVLEQCAAFGDLHHAIEAGVVTSSHVHATLADLVSHEKPGRTSADEIIIFDSTGTAIEDVAAAAMIYERALERGCGRVIDFNQSN